MKITYRERKWNKWTSSRIHERFLLKLKTRTRTQKKREREIETLRSKWIYWLRRKRLLPVAGFRCWVSFYIKRLIVFQFNNTSLVASPCPYFFHQTIIVFRDARMVAIFPISMFSPSFGFFVSRVSILPV